MVSFIEKELTQKKVHYIFLLLSITIVLIVGKIFNIELRGIYPGIFVGCIFFLIPNKFVFINKYIFLVIAIINFFLLGYNTFLFGKSILPPIIGGGEGTFEKVIERSIFFVGYELRLKRNTGFVDNIHVSAFINLLLIFYSSFKKWRVVKYIAILLLLLNLNLQFILIYFLWSILKDKNVTLNYKKIIIFFFIFLLFFLAIDNLFMSGGYSQQIGATNFEALGLEFASYANYMKIEDWLFGLKVFEEDFYQGNDFGYYVPLTDIGLFGFPIQFGFIGVILMFFCYSFWLKFSAKQLKFFLLICLLMLLHYFTIASFWGIFMIFLILSFQRNLFDTRHA